MGKEKTPEEKVREMLKTGEGWEEFDETLRNVSVSCTPQPLAKDKEREILLNTGTVLDDLFGGGLSAGQTVELFGEYASGKTQVVFTCIVEAADKGLVIVEDNEDTFSRKRILQIAESRGKDIDKINNNILLYSPTNWQEQLAIPASLPDPLPTKLRLVVIDSLMALFRSTPEFSGRQNLGKRQELLRYHLRQWKLIAKEQKCIVIYTNQVYDKPVSNPFLPPWASQEAAGGHSVWHVGDYRIFLRKAAGNVRIARLVDNSEIQSTERIFQINKMGIDDLPKEQKEAAMKQVQEWENKQSTGTLKKFKVKPKKKVNEAEETKPDEPDKPEAKEENEFEQEVGDN